MLGTRYVEKEVREFAFALVNVRSLGKDLPERRDAFFRCALIGRAELPVEVLDHPDVLPELRQITLRGVQSCSCAAGVNVIGTGYVPETGVGNVQREIIEPRSRWGGLILLAERRMQRTR